METIRTISVEDLKAGLDRGDIALVDVREYPEFTEGHVAGARLVPLGELRRSPALGKGPGGAQVALLCRSGRRAREAAAILCGAGHDAPVVVEGGIEAWKRAGHPVRRVKGPISLERQVRIGAGALVLTGLLVPGLRFLPYVVGTGLVFAGVTDICGMGLLLARLPWNRRKDAPASCGAA